MQNAVNEAAKMRAVMRRSGVLLPITSIPSKYGIGGFSKESNEFVDFLEKAGQSLWQIGRAVVAGEIFCLFLSNQYHKHLAMGFICGHTHGSRNGQNIGRHTGSRSGQSIVHL